MKKRFKLTSADPSPRDSALFLLSSVGRRAKKTIDNRFMKRGN